MNIVKTWEEKAIHEIKMNQLSDDYDHERYVAAMAFCECISAFTDDKDEWDCYDRLMVQSLKELGVNTDFAA